MDIQFHKTVEMKVKNPTIILGLPGTGLVGSVSASHIVEKLGLTFAGYITSPSFAPLAAIHNYTPLPAARIHYSAEKNLVVILSEMSIPVASSQELADKVLEFAKTLKAPFIISLGGVTMKEGENVVYVVSSDQKLSKTLLAKKGVKPIKEGATTGVTGVLLTNGVLQNYPVISILAEASSDYLDPKAAGNALRVLSEFINLPIDTKELDKEAVELAKTIRDNMAKSKPVAKKLSSVREESGSMYG
jgi:uncharacterized protein